MGLLSHLTGLFRQRRDDLKAQLADLDEKIDRGEGIDADLAEAIEKLAPKCSNALRFPKEPVTFLAAEMKSFPGRKVLFEGIEGRQRRIIVVTEPEHMDEFSRVMVALATRYPDPQMEIDLLTFNDFGPRAPEEVYTLPYRKVTI